MKRFLLHKNHYIFAIWILTILVVGCNDVTIQNNEQEKEDATNNTSTLVATIPYNLMMRIDATGDLRQLHKGLQDTPLADRFTTNKEAYTLFGPSNKSLRKLKRTKDTLDFQALAKNHMVSGMITTVSLTKNIRNNGGTYTLTTVEGKKLIAFRKGVDIFIKNDIGEEAQIGKSDITATNGMIHVIDQVLYP